MAWRTTRTRTSRSRSPQGHRADRHPLEAGETVYLSVDNGFAAQFANIDVPPGGTIPVTLTTSSGDSASAEVPVLNGLLPEYEDYLP
ncbi:hypothetical protein NKG05_18390 [Oerskovia sp. M15]